MSERRSASGSAHIHLFVYGTLLAEDEAARLLDGCERIGPAVVSGALYEVDDAYPALVLAGNGAVRGEIWRCPPEILPALDAYEGVAQGLFRRVAVRVGETACWTYVAGSALAHRLAPERRIPSGRWSASGRR